MRGAAALLAIAAITGIYASWLHVSNATTVALTFLLVVQIVMPGTLGTMKSLLNPNYVIKEQSYDKGGGALPTRVVHGEGSDQQVVDLARERAPVVRAPSPAEEVQASLELGLIEESKVVRDGLTERHAAGREEHRPDEERHEPCPGIAPQLPDRSSRDRADAGRLSWRGLSGASAAGLHGAMLGCGVSCGKGLRRC